MATRSIMTSVNIKGRSQVKEFVNALERAEGYKGKPVKFSRQVKTVSDEELKKMAALFKA